MKIFITAIVTFFVTALLAAGGYVWIYLRGGIMPPEPTLVRVENPVRGDLREFISARAEVEPKTKVNISARVSARIVDLPYDEGDRVTKGDPDADPPVPPSLLVQLDATDFEAALRAAEARRAAQEAQLEVERARIDSQRSTIDGIEASLKQAKEDLERQTTLLETRDISQATYDAAAYKVQELEAQLASAKHTLESAKKNLRVLEHNLKAADAEIEQARDKLTYTTITSPIDGTIARLSAEEGETVIPGTMNNPGTAIMTVADFSKMLLVAQVDETDIDRVKEGQHAVAEIHACPGEEFEGTVDSVALAHDVGFGGVKYFKTEVLLKLDGRRVYWGSTADVKIETARHENVLKVPSQAVLERLVDELPLEVREGNENVQKDKTYTTVVYGYRDGKAVVTPVKVGASDEIHTMIESGVGEEDRVIVGPYKVLEGIKHDQEVLDEREAAEKQQESESEEQSAKDE